MVLQMDSQALMIRQELLNTIKYPLNMCRAPHCTGGINLAEQHFCTVKMHYLYAVSYICTQRGMWGDLISLLFSLIPVKKVRDFAAT